MLYSNYAEKVDIPMDMTGAGGRIRQLKQGPPLFVVSGGTGSSGELVVRGVLAQFPDAHVPVQVEAHVLTAEQIRAVIRKASGITGAIIVHTMVSAELRHLLMEEAAQTGIVTFDLSGLLLNHLRRELDMEPLGQPGLYRKQNKPYFDRIAAMEYTVAHDDGKRTEELEQAEIILIGVSRVGKTPLSIYLSVLGWKVANVPFVPQLQMPPELFAGDQRRLVGLMIGPAQLVLHRKLRQQRTGIPEGSYIALQDIREELRAANHYFYDHGIAVVDTTDKPIETSADEIVALVTRQRSEL